MEPEPVAVSLIQGAELFLFGVFRDGYAQRYVAYVAADGAVDDVHDIRRRNAFLVKYVCAQVQVGEPGKLVEDLVDYLGTLPPETARERRDAGMGIVLVGRVHPGLQQPEALEWLPAGEDDVRDAVVASLNNPVRNLFRRCLFAARRAKIAAVAASDGAGFCHAHQQGGVIHLAATSFSGGPFPDPLALASANFIVTLPLGVHIRRNGLGPPVAWLRSAYSPTRMPAPLAWARTAARACAMSSSVSPGMSARA